MAGVETTMEELSAIAKAMDSGKSLEEARATIAPPEAEPEKPESETQADPPPELGQPKSNGELNPSSGGESSLTEKTEQTEPDVSREAKEMERKMRSWSSLNTEKEKHQQRVDEFDQRQEKWKLQQMESTNELRDEEGYSAKDYDKVESEFREDGEGKLADNAKANAESLRESERVTAQKLNQKDFSKTFSDNYASARANYPDLGNHDSELFKRTEQVFLHYPELLGDADGPRKAAWVASRDILATQTESFRDENQRLTNELEEYKSKLSIGGSQPAPRPANKEFMDMDTDARFKMMTANAAQMDRQSGG
jgi:hypothetical protein|tara:strand:- start:89 stop:1018 length:930 start_codon:yes stop_codon:yes gene_type:complete